MIAKTSWKRVTALVLALLIAHAPSAFAGRLLDSAMEAAAEVTARQVPPDDEAAIAGALARSGKARAAAAQAPEGQGDGGRGAAGRMWALIGAGVAIGLIMMKVDFAVEDSTPSTNRERRDGCTLFCS